MIVEADYEKVEVSRDARHSSDLLFVAVKYSLSGKRKPIAVPTRVLVPEGGPDMIVEADYEKVEVSRDARHSSDLLFVAVKYSLSGKRKPIAVPTRVLVPEGGPDMIVEADYEKIEVSRDARHSSDLLFVAVKYSLSGKRKPIAVPTQALR